MFCDNCGKEVSDNMKFCRNCGARIEKEKPVTDQAVLPEEGKAAAPSNAPKDDGFLYKETTRNPDGTTSVITVTRYDPSAKNSPELKRAAKEGEKSDRALKELQEHPEGTTSRLVCLIIALMGLAAQFIPFINLTGKSFSLFDMGLELVGKKNTSFVLSIVKEDDKAKIVGFVYFAVIAWGLWGLITAVCKFKETDIKKADRFWQELISAACCFGLAILFFSCTVQTTKDEHMIISRVISLDMSNNETYLSYILAAMIVMIIFAAFKVKKYKRAKSAIKLNETVADAAKYLNQKQ